MQPISWSEKFNTGLRDLDEQHHHLVDLINACIVQAGRRKAVDPALVGRLRQDAVAHFRREEALLEAAGYEDVGRHRAQHRYFEARIRDLEAPRPTAPERLVSLLTFLANWITHHILGVDRRYVPSLSRQAPAIA